MRKLLGKALQFNLCKVPMVGIITTQKNIEFPLKAGHAPSRG